MFYMATIPFLQVYVGDQLLMLNGERLVELTPKDCECRPLCVISHVGWRSGVAYMYLVTVVHVVSTQTPPLQFRGGEYPRV